MDLQKELVKMRLQVKLKEMEVRLKKAQLKQEKMRADQREAAAPPAKRRRATPTASPPPPPQPSASPTPRTTCRFFASGSCLAGTQCRFSHGTPCESCGKPVTEEVEERAKHLEQCRQKRARAAEVKASQSVTCNLCQHRVVDKGGKFAILPECEHAFCFECIKNHRDGRETGSSVDKKALRQCPVCSVTSNYIIPLDRHVSDATRKQHVVSEYKKRLSRIPCRRFNQGRGACPMGKLCMYLHDDGSGDARHQEQHWEWSVGKDHPGHEPERYAAQPAVEQHVPVSMSRLGLGAEMDFTQMEYEAQGLGHLLHAAPSASQRFSIPDPRMIEEGRAVYSTSTPGVAPRGDFVHPSSRARGVVNLALDVEETVFLPTLSDYRPSTMRSKASPVPPPRVPFVAGTGVRAGVRATIAPFTSPAITTPDDEFGDFERHTTGFGSRMLRRMGYTMGRGLGPEQQGRVLPVAAGREQQR